MKNVFKSIIDPVHSIKANKGGWKEFVSKEIFPLSLKADRSNYFPNYMTHAVGNGMLYVKMSEWYHYNGFACPGLMSVLTTTAYQFLNEVAENGSRQTPNTDPVADMLIFNPLGFALFSFDWTKEFFTQTIELNDWSLQPVYLPYTYFLENAGQQYSIKFPLPFIESTKGFFYWGINGLTGFSFDIGNEESISLGAGTVVNKLLEIENVDGGVVDHLIDPKLDGSVGIFYDKNNSLLASLIFSGPKEYNARLNIYPGVFRNKVLAPGLYIGAGETDGFKIGLTTIMLPFGFGFGG